jgi:dihydrofolate synthase/folylpolyglutamate synthase
MNAATAIVAAEGFLGRALGQYVVSTTMASARMPGRMELISRRPMIVVDGAHNPAGVNALVATLDGAFHVNGERRCVLGMLTGRDIDDMVGPLVAVGLHRVPLLRAAVAARGERARGR